MGRYGRWELEIQISGLDKAPPKPNKQKPRGYRERGLRMATHLDSDKRKVWMRIRSLGPKQAALSKIVTVGQERSYLISGDDD